MSRESVVFEPGEVAVERDIVFGRAGGRDLRLELYHPAEQPDAAPAVLMIHGGGWPQGSRDMPGIVAFGTLLSDAGYLCAAIEHRLSGEATWPAQLHDARSALDWLHANARTLGVHRGRIAVLGKSAGAHLALVMAAAKSDPDGNGDGGGQEGDPSIGPVVAFYPPTRLQRPGMAESEAVRAPRSGGSATVGRGSMRAAGDPLR